MKYTVREMFVTAQGEGFNAGTLALFVRFTGCNLWTGRVEDRESSSKRNGADCPNWCDTDFVGGKSYTADQLVAEAVRIVESENRADRAAWPLIVFTGGEPTLQLTADLLVRFERAFTKATLAVESNGTIAELRDGTPVEVLAGELRGWWLTISPKTLPDGVLVRVANEVKVVWPQQFIDPRAMRSRIAAQHYYLQPKATPHLDGRGLSVLSVAAHLACIDYAIRTAGDHSSPWRLSFQGHKTGGLR